MRSLPAVLGIAVSAGSGDDGELICKTTKRTHRSAVHREESCLLAEDQSSKCVSSRYHRGRDSVLDTRRIFHYKPSMFEPVRKRRRKTSRRPILWPPRQGRLILRLLSYFRRSIQSPQETCDSARAHEATGSACDGRQRCGTSRPSLDGICATVMAAHKRPLLLGFSFWRLVLAS